MKAITYQRNALRQLRKIPVNEAQKIVGKINQYAENPESLTNNIIRIQGSPHFRLRIGNWRVIFDEDNTVINIIRIQSRGSVYQ